MDRIGRWVAWALRALVFVALLGFAVKNSAPVTVRFFFASAWELPLVSVMLAFFAGGALFGLGAAVPRLLRQRRELQRLRQAGPPSAEPGAPPF